MSIINTNDRQDQGYQGDRPEDNGQYIHQQPYTLYDDPAVINPAELATFPKQMQATNYQPHYHHHHHHDNHDHHVNKRTPVRDGRNITRTDNHPDKNGFM